MMTSDDIHTAETSGPTLHVLGAFSLRLDDLQIDVPPAGQRVLALLAVLGGGATRSRLAGTLWPDHPESRALSNLRAAVWRLPARARDIIERRGTSMCLAPAVWVDLRQSNDLARRLLDGVGPEVCDQCDARTRELLAHDLLPSVDEDWTIVPREQHRQQRLHALEALAKQQLACDRPLDAVDSALTAVATEPLRESAQMLVIRAHLHAGNRAAALRQFEQFCEVLDHEMGMRPSPDLIELLSAACGRRGLGR